MGQTDTIDRSSVKSVLIADDDMNLCTALSQKLGNQGIYVHLAHNGDDALETALKHHPDLTVLDVVMPGKTGTEVLEELRHDEWGKTAKVVMVSNVNSVDAYNEALASGANDFFSKHEISLEAMVDFIKDRL